MAANIDGTYPDDHQHAHAAGCGCEGCIADASGDSDAPIAGTVVADYTALLYYLDNDSLRWNAIADVGTQTVITYSFTETNELASVSTDPYGATAYWAYDAAQRDLFRAVTEQYEDVSGVIFVEIEGDAMINVFGTTGGTAGGWANVAQSGATFTSNGQLTNNYMSMDAGDYGYQVNLHELGHAMGLMHPFEGSLTLDSNVDNQANTVMTYNIQNPYVSELGVFDIQALEQIYGAADSFDGWTVTVDAFDTVTIVATNSADIILATDQNTEIFGGKGRDEIIGREGDDWMKGGKGADTMTGGLGEDTMYGNSGDDYILGGTSEDEYWDGTTDKILGGSGDDFLYGGAGDDKIFGGGDNDTMFGGRDNDTLNGGNNDDILNGDNGDDRLRGGSGNDVFVFDTYNDSDTVLDFVSGEDTLDVSFYGFSSVGQFNIAESGGDTTISYSTWFEVVLSNYTDTLTNADFAFV